MHLKRGVRLPQLGQAQRGRMVGELGVRGTRARGLRLARRALQRAAQPLGVRGRGGAARVRRLPARPRLRQRLRGKRV